MNRDIALTEFKKNFSQLLDQISKTGQPLRITRNGRPVAEIRSLVPAKSIRKRKFLGNMIGTAEIVGDIVSPVINTD
jgi:prevent-host-death family protein